MSAYLGIKWVFYPAGFLLGLVFAVLDKGMLRLALPPWMNAGTGKSGFGAYPGFPGPARSDYLSLCVSGVAVWFTLLASKGLTLFTLLGTNTDQWSFQHYLYECFAWPWAAIVAFMAVKLVIQASAARAHARVLFSATGDLRWYYIVFWSGMMAFTIQKATWIAFGLGLLSLLLAGSTLFTAEFLTQYG